MFVGKVKLLLLRDKFTNNHSFKGKMNPHDVINGYRIIKPIGAGGAGYLYHAEREGLEVCLKECRFGLRADDPEASDVVRLFEREVSTLRDLNHPGIPKYSDFFSANDGGEERLYLAMELVRGKNLADLVADKRITLDYVLKVAQELAETLLYTHAFVPPIIHRDIKPENIIQPDAEGSRVKLVDFGSVTGAVLKRTLATHNTIAGTPGYAAPEIWHGKECPATDIYSLGATLLYLLSAGRTPGEFLNDDLRLDFKGKLNGTPAWFEQLVHEMTEPNVTRRVKNAGELLGRLYRKDTVVSLSTPNESEEPSPVQGMSKNSTITNGYVRIPKTQSGWNLRLFSRRPTLEQINSRMKQFMETIIGEYRTIGVKVEISPLIVVDCNGLESDLISLRDYLESNPHLRQSRSGIHRVVYSLRIENGSKPGEISYNNTSMYDDFRMAVPALTIPSSYKDDILTVSQAVETAFQEFAGRHRKRTTIPSAKIDPAKQLTP